MKKREINFKVPKKITLSDICKEPTFTKKHLVKPEIIEALSEATIELSGAKPETPIGTLSVDIVAEDTSGKEVPIEVQYGKTDADHLGKLIRYTYNLGAEMAIWIAEEIRQEDVIAVNGLNEETSKSFFLVQIQAFKGTEGTNINFIPVVTPSEDVKRVGAKQKEKSVGELQHSNFIEALRNAGEQKDNSIGGIVEGTYMWFSHRINKHEAFVELLGDSINELEKIETVHKFFEELEKNKDTIEKEIGEPLHWDIIEDRKVCRVSLKASPVGYVDEELYDNIINASKEKMKKLQNALSPFINKLKSGK